MDARPLSLNAIHSDLTTGQLLLKQSEEWEKAHGLGYHLLTLVMVLTGCLPLVAYALTQRTNPHKGHAYLHLARWRRNVAAHDRAHGLPTLKDLKRGAAAHRPAKARAPGPARPALAF